MQHTSVRHEALRWDDVRLFLALCRARTVGGAATLLAVDASTVSRRLVALEEVVAATLFDRTREGIHATKAAEDLVPIAEEIEEPFGLDTNDLPLDRLSEIIGANARELLAQ